MCLTVDVDLIICCRLSFLWFSILESVDVQDDFLGILFGMICEHDATTNPIKSQKVRLGVESTPEVCGVAILITGGNLTLLK